MEFHRPRRPITTKVEKFQTVRSAQVNLLSAMTSRLVLQDATSNDAKYALGLNHWMEVNILRDSCAREGPRRAKTSAYEAAQDPEKYSFYSRYTHTSGLTIKNFRMSTAVLLASFMTSISRAQNEIVNTVLMGMEHSAPVQQSLYLARL